MLTFPQGLLRPGDRVACAVSGGADSTALLLLLHAARTALGVGVSALHVNHSLRGEESLADEQFVRDVCARLDLPLHIVTVDTASYAREHGETIEEAGRSVRVDAFQRLIASGQANVVLTAHTLDDQAETVLMKLLRGAWTEGLGGISPGIDVPGGRIVRPLLTLRREDLRAYLTKQKQTWREDSSNTDERFTRNRIRAVMLPALREENPSIDHTLANLAEVAREEEARWQAELPKMLPHLILPGKPVRGGGRSSSTAPGEQSLAMELERLRPLDPATRRRVVRAAARSLGARLSFDETTRLLALSGFPATPPDPTVPTKPGSKLQFAGGLLAERSPRELRLSRKG